MGSIDNRIVRMEFDNQRFERGVQQSIESMDALKKGLDFERVGKSITDFAQKGNALNGIASGVDNISNKFSALGAIAFTVLQRMTNASIDFGKKIGNALIGPLVEGGKTRALNIQQAKFQFEGLGMDVEATMKSALDAVRGTAYGLDAAAKVASMLGASGMRAGDGMTKSLRAVAGVAAMTASEYEDIGQIFTTVAGNGRLMGDQLLQLSSKGINAAAVLAKSLGKTEAEVREMVSDGKISFQMFSDAMDDAFGAHSKAANKLFTGALKNTRAALGRIGAEVAGPIYNNMRDVLNTLIPVIDALAVALKPLINGIIKAGDAISRYFIDVLNKVDVGPVQVFLEGIINLFGFLLNLIKPIGRAFKEIFPGKTRNELMSMAIIFRGITAQMVFVGDRANDLKDTFKGVFAIFSIVGQVLSAVASGFWQVLKAIFPVGDGILSITGTIGRFFISLDDMLKKSGVLQVIFGAIADALTPIAKLLAFLLKKIGDTFKGFAEINFSGLENFGNKLKDHFEPMEKTGDYLLNTVSPRIELIATALKNMFAALAEWIGPKVKAMKWGNIGDIFNTVMLMGILNAMKQFMDTGGGITPIMAGLRSSLFEFKNVLMAYQNQIKAKALFTIATAIAILAAALLVLSFIDPIKLLAATAAIGSLFAMLVVSMNSMDGISTDGIKGSVKLAVAMFAVQAMAVAILILAAAMKVLSTIKPMELIWGLATIVVLIETLIQASERMTAGTTDMIKMAAMLWLMSFAINGLARAVKKMGQLGWEELAKGLIGVGALLGSLLLFSKFAKMDANSLQTTAGLLLLAVAIGIMASAVEKLGMLDISTLMKGLGSIAYMFLMIGAFQKMAPDTTESLKMAVSIVIISAAMHVFAGALKKLGTLDGETIGKGLVAMGAGLLIISLAMHAMPKDALTTAAAVTVMAGALFILATVMVMLGAMPILNILQALGAIAAVFVILGVASMLLAPLLPVMFGLAAVIAILGAGLLMGGAALLAFGLGITALVAIGVVGVGILIEVIKEFAIGITNNAVTIAKAFGAMFVALLEEALLTIPKLVEVLFAFINEMLATFVENIPKMVDAGLKLILGVLTGIKNNIKEIVKTGMEIVVQIIQGITEGLPDLIDAGFKLIISFVNGVADAIRNNTDAILAAAENLGNAVVDGLIKGIKKVFSKPVDLISGLGKAMLDGLKKILGIHSPSKETEAMGIYLVEGLTNAISSKTKSAVTAAKTMGTKILDALENVVSGNIEINPTIRPVLDLAGVSSGARSLNGMFANARLNISGTDARIAAITSKGVLSNSSPSINPTVTNNNKEINPTFIINANGLDEAGARLLMGKINKELGALL